MRTRRDIEDLDESIFTREEAIRLRLDRGAMAAAGAERLRQEAVVEAATKERMVAYTADTNRQMIMQEYAVRGLTPRPGVLVSLSMLLQIGWKIEDHPDGGAVLVAPPKPEKYVAKGECS